MTAEIILAPEAEQDLAEAYVWYESRRRGLGEEFINCVDASIEAISRMPEMHSIVHESYRRGLVRRFPYTIFYEYAEGAATIYCIFHTSRDPEKWRERLA